MKKFTFIFTLLIGLTFTSLAQKTSASGDNEAKLIKCYPIPATTVVNFEFQRGYDRNYTFQVFSFIGKKVYELVNPTQKIAIPLDEYYRGFYYYKVLDKSGELLESGRFIVVK